MSSKSEPRSVGGEASVKSTAIKAQLALVLTLLRQGPKTTMELRLHSIMMPAARVFQLKREHGHVINTELVALYDAAGVQHRKCARYHLVDAPSQQCSLFEGPPC